MKSTEIYKDLLKSKEMATMSHYCSGEIFYKVKLSDGIYQFPIRVVEKKEVSLFSLNVGENSKDVPFSKYKDDVLELSEELGNTIFQAECRGSELFRLIKIAIKDEKFWKIS